MELCREGIPEGLNDQKKNVASSDSVISNKKKTTLELVSDTEKQTPDGSTWKDSSEHL